MEWRNGVCTEAMDPTWRSACEAPGGAAGMCVGRTCVTDFVEPSWSREARGEWGRLLGRGSGGREVLIRSWGRETSPFEGEVHPVTVRSREHVDRLDAPVGDSAPALDAWDFSAGIVAHRRYLLGTLSTSASTRSLAVLRLEPEGEAPRLVDGAGLLAPELLAAGLPTTGLPDSAWVQGPPGRMWVVLQPTEQQTWISGFDLEGLRFEGGHVLPGTRRGQPIADEEGQLYLPLTSPEGTALLVALGPDGRERWRLEGDARARAVFGGTLFLDDGTVRDTVTGALRYTWPADPDAQVRLSAEHAAVVRNCGPRCVRASLLDRRTGAVLAEAGQDANPAVRGGSLEESLLTDDGRIVVIQGFGYPELSSFRSFHGSLRFFELGPSGALQRKGEYFLPTQESFAQAVLSDGAIVLRQWGDWANAMNETSSSFHGFAWPGYRPPAHGWLTETGGSNSFGPE